MPKIRSCRWLAGPLSIALLCIAIGGESQAAERPASAPAVPRGAAAKPVPVSRAVAVSKVAASPEKEVRRALPVAELKRPARRNELPPGNLHLRLHDCIDLALEKNFNLAIRRVLRESAWDQLDLSWGTFEPEAFAGGGRRFINGITTIGGRDIDDVFARGGIVGRLPTGATLELANDYGATATGASPRFFNSTTELTLRQPLLRGGGFGVNLLPIRLARIEVKQANAELRRGVLDLVTNVEAQWWELVFAYRDRELVGNTLRSSEKLLAEANARVKVGLATDIETLQAKTGVAARREAIVIADQRIEDRMDDLLLLLGQLGKARYGIDLPGGLPRIEKSNLSVQEAVAFVHALPEYSIQFDTIRQHQLLVSRAKNDLLPRLDVVAAGGYRGAGLGSGSALDRSLGRSGADPDWQLLAEVRVPLGFMKERAELRRTKNALEIEELKRADLEQSLLSQLREAERAVTAGLLRMELTAASARLSSQQFEQLLARFKEGLNSFREMQLAEEDLQEAGSRSLAAQLDAIRASLRLARLEGTIIARHDLTWGDQQ
jgi:outer membrane protein